MAKKKEKNFKTLCGTNILMNFVKRNKGSWEHSDWEELLVSLNGKGYTNLDPEQLGLKLEEKKKQYLSK